MSVERQEFIDGSMPEADRLNWLKSAKTTFSFPEGEITFSLRETTFTHADGSSQTIEHTSSIDEAPELRGEE